VFNTKKVNRMKINKKLFSKQGNNGFYRKEFVPVLSVDIIIKQCIEANKGLTHNGKRSELRISQRRKFKKNVEKSSKHQNVEIVFFVFHYYEIRTSKMAF
jgi:hypothetical protein